MYKFTLFLKSSLLILIFNIHNRASAQVGVNTTTPAYDFEVVNTGNIGATTLAQSTNNGTDGVALTGYNTDATNGFNAIEGATDGTNSGVYGLSLPATGFGTGVFGAANSSDAVGVFGTIPTTGTWLGFGGLFSGGLAYSDGLYNLSDSNAKANIKSIDNALSKLLNINGYSYTYAYNRFNPNIQNSNTYFYGFLAQNIKDYLPFAVIEKKVRFPNSNQSLATNNSDLMTAETLNVVDYTAIIPVTVEAIKEQQETIEKQKIKIKTLEERILSLEKKVDHLINTKD